MAESNDRRAIEWAKCSADAGYFADSYGVIQERQDKRIVSGETRFRLWPAQVEVMWALMTSMQVIILKARQLGISWLCCAYALWLCVFQSGKLVLLFSQGEREANELLDRIRFMYERLPEWMRTQCPYAKEPNTTEIEWANGSRVESKPATKKAGRSLTASLVILDEAAHQQWAEELYTAAKPTIDGGGQLIVLSTANGIGNLFHWLWLQASQHLNEFKAIFLPWWSRPGRDQAWYDKKAREAKDPALHKQEYPASATEAFLVSGRVRFDPMWIDRQSAEVRKPLAEHRLPPALRGISGLEVFELPSDSRRVVIAADVAEGLEHGDFSAAVALDAETWEELASLHGHWEPDEFGELLAILVEAYDAYVIVERNNHGHATISKLNDLCPHRVADGPDDRAGWLSNAQTKPQAIDALAVALRDGLAKIHSQAALDELRIYRIEANGRTTAPPGFHDDRVMAWAIGIGWIQMVGWPSSAWSADPFADSR